MAGVTRFFHPVLAARKLRKRPVKVRVAGHDYVLWRDGTGRAAAFVDACPHRKTPLSAGRVRPDGRLQCPYHGWHFDADGRGASPSQPTLKKCDASAMQILERHGYLWLAERETPRSAFPRMQWPGFDLAGTFSVLFEAPLHVALDNFSEDEHTPWVHTRLGWEEQDAGAIEFEAHNFDDRTEVTYRARQRNSPVRVLIGARKNDTFNNEWVTYFDPVRTIYTLYWSDPQTHQRRGMTARPVIFMVPETERRTRFHVFVHTRIDDRRLRLISALVKKAAVALAWAEVLDDARFIPTVADTPFELQGMRLGKYDKPLVHNHKLLRDIYWANDDTVLPLDRTGSGRR
jgi:phenylpropionate dioxygenase-like ring-hydroxylating dioxygenase large terminal subunit